MAYEEIKQECEQMQTILELCIPTDGNGAVSHATTLAAYMARSGQLLADSKRLLRQKQVSEINKTIIAIAKEACLSAKVQNTLLASIADNEMYLVEWLDRINASCVHSIDLCRSIISKEKEEMRIVKMGY